MEGRGLPDCGLRIAGEEEEVANPSALRNPQSPFLHQSLPLRVIIPRAHDAGDGQIVAPDTS
jgi:hypothetical protein